MLIYPPAKINIGLYVTGKREDGYHNISSLFFPVKFHDILEFLPCNNPLQKSDQLTTTGISIPGNNDDNIILKACREMRKISDFPFINIHLHKMVPLGAGLGGGSSNASGILKGLQKIAIPEPSLAELETIALNLGSDCPFFLNPVSSIASGRGEFLKPFEISLDGLWISIFNPGIHVSTAEAYKSVETGHPEVPLEKALAQPVESWKNDIFNVFENSVFDIYPDIGELKKSLYKSGALFASMTGSGSSVFGIFREPKDWPHQLRKAHVWTGQA